MDDKTKWNGKYKSRLQNREVPGPNERLKNVSFSLSGKKALDLACGLGGNSLFLAKLGYYVESVDISDVAIHYLQHQAEKENLEITTQIADLSDLRHLDYEENSFDVIVVTYYLDRSVFPYVTSLLKKNGYFFMETFYLSPFQEGKEISDQYKLHSNELLEEFRNYHILFFEEQEQEGRQTIFCRKK